MNETEGTKPEQVPHPQPRFFTFAPDSDVDLGPRSNACGFSEIGAPGFGAAFAELSEETKP